jgi:hypothetical protein
VDGEGLQNQYGTLGLDLEWMHAVDIEIPIPDNPAWNSFRFALVSREIVDDGQWVQFQDGEIKKLEAVGRLKSDLELVSARPMSTKQFCHEWER